MARHKRNRHTHPLDPQPSPTSNQSAGPTNELRKVIVPHRPAEDFLKSISENTERGNETMGYLVGETQDDGKGFCWHLSFTIFSFFPSR